MYNIKHITKLFLILLLILLISSCNNNNNDIKSEINNILNQKYNFIEIKVTTKYSNNESLESIYSFTKLDNKNIYSYNINELQEIDINNLDNNNYIKNTSGSITYFDNEKIELSNVPYFIDLKNFSLDCFKITNNKYQVFDEYIIFNNYYIYYNKINNQYNIDKITYNNDNLSLEYRFL